MSTVQLKRLVSKKKRRYVDKDFDLDLSYINDRVIAMGYPSVGKEAVYRNPRPQVVKFFDTRHKGHYKVYNLCSERQYDPSVFHGSVARYPFDDHNCPPLSLIFACCKDIAAFLAEDDENVVALHCKAGKGRTGLLICCWLLFNNDWQDAESSLRFYAAARTHNQKGVTIPSQIRYVHNFDKAIHRGHQGHECPSDKLLMLRSFTLRNVPTQGGGVDLTVKIRAHGKTVVPTTVKNWRGKPEVLTKRKGKCDLSIPIGQTPLSGDIHIRVDSKVRSFMFWFNTFFVEDGKLVLTKPEIDKASKDKELSDSFAVELVFTSPKDDSTVAALAAMQSGGIDPNGNAGVGVRKLEYRYAESLGCF